MKKIIAFFAVVLFAGALAGCEMNSPTNSTGKNNSNNQNSTNNNKNQNGVSNNTDSSNKENKPAETNLATIKEYFPMKQNTRYIYKGAGNEFASYDVYNDYISGDKVQQRINNGGTAVINVLELNGGQLSKVYSRKEAFYRENLLNKTGDEKEILLLEPLKKGTTWQLSDGRKKTITNIEADLTTPTGNYKTIEVTTESSKDKTIDYYAQNIGLVKSIFVSGASTITSTLAKIEENVPLTQTINFYYPNINDEKIYFKRTPVIFHTNELTRKVLEETYKKPINNQLGSVLSKNTEINSLYLNQDGKVYIDLNHAFMEEMNAGANFENMILQSLVNTVGHYYQVEKVYLTVDNKPYESGHISMGKGDYFNVQTQNTIEIQ